MTGIGGAWGFWVWVKLTPFSLGVLDFALLAEVGGECKSLLLAYAFSHIVWR